MLTFDFQATNSLWTLSSNAAAVVLKPWAGATVGRLREGMAVASATTARSDAKRNMAFLLRFAKHLSRIDNFRVAKGHRRVAPPRPRFAYIIRPSLCRTQVSLYVCSCDSLARSRARVHAAARPAPAAGATGALRSGRPPRAVFFMAVAGGAAQ